MPDKKTDSIDFKLNFRRAEIADVPAIGKFASELALQHVGYDKLRFVPPAPIVEAHENFFADEIRNKNAVILVLELNDEVAGYAFIRVEPPSFIDLLEAGAWLHDIYLSKAARGRGVSKLFMETIIKEAQKLGSKSLMLSVSPQNETAQNLFKDYGFRPTMTEMRLDF